MKYRIKRYIEVRITWLIMDWFRMLHVLKLREHKLDWDSVELEGINTWDYPKFCDAFIASAGWDDGTDLNDEELDRVNDEEGDSIHAKVYENLY